MNSVNRYNNTPSFQAYYKSSFSKQLEKSLATGEGIDELSDSFAKIVKSRKNSTSKMGKDGLYGGVYRLDDYYVFKIYHNDKELKTKPFRKVVINCFEDLKTYCGNVIARFGRIEIIPNATKDKKKFLELGNALENGIETYSRSIKEFATLPQKQFDMLARDFAELNIMREGNINYMFDTHNPNNLLKIGKSIKIVDEIAVTPCKDPNDIYAFLRAFIQNGGDPEAKKTVFKKCILASEKNLLPMESAIKYFPDRMNVIFQDAGINESFENFYKTMKEYRCSEDHMKLVEKYLENI